MIDISNPASPTLKGTCPTTQAAWSRGQRLLRIRGGPRWGLQVIDISDPASPILKGTCRHHLCRWSRGQRLLRLRGEVLEWGPRVIDISNPDYPTLKGTYSTSYAGSRGQRHLCLRGGQRTGLQVIDISNPASPTLKGTCATSYAQGVAVSGSYAYVATIRRLRVVDISDPASPISRVPVPRSAWSRGQRLLRLRGGLHLRPAGDRHLQSCFSEPRGQLPHPYARESRSAAPTPMWLTRMACR